MPCGSIVGMFDRAAERTAFCALLSTSERSRHTARKLMKRVVRGEHSFCVAGWVEAKMCGHGSVVVLVKGPSLSPPPPVTPHSRCDHTTTLTWLMPSPSPRGPSASQAWSRRAPVPVKSSSLNIEPGQEAYCSGRENTGWLQFFCVLSFAVTCLHALKASAVSSVERLPLNNEASLVFHADRSQSWSDAYMEFAKF